MNEQAKAARQSGSPALARKLLNLFIPADLRDVIIGDLEEEFHLRLLPRYGRWLAGGWYWRQTLQTLYIYLNKQRSSVMGFIISVLFFVGLTLMAILLGGEIAMYVNLPSLLITIPPAIAFGVAATSVQAMKDSLKLAMTEQPDVDKTQLKQAIGFLRVTGNSAMLLGTFMTLLGFVAMANNIEAEVFTEVFGPAFAIAILTLVYALALKLLCYIAEQKIRLHYPSE